MENLIISLFFAKTIILLFIVLWILGIDLILDLFQSVTE